MGTESCRLAAVSKQCLHNRNYCDPVVLFLKYTLRQLTYGAPENASRDMRQWAAVEPQKRHGSLGSFLSACVTACDGHVGVTCAVLQVHMEKLLPGAKA